MALNPAGARRHVIVIGGSIAGLLAARVVSDYYDKVTIIERDVFPPVGEQRRGVPQARHTHGLLASGCRVLENLFPGLSNELIGDGALSGDIVADSRWFHEGGCLSRFDSGLKGLLMSRPLLEGRIRARVLGLTHVRTRENCRVEGLSTDASSRVIGVKVGAEVLSADLVVDATGRGSHAPEWLQAIGYQKPVEERVEIALAYTTRLFRRHSQDLNGDTAVIIPPTPLGKKGGVMLAQEGSRWTVTLISHFGSGAPSELAGFIEYSRGLPSPDIHEVIRNSEPLGEASATRFPASVRHRYENLTRFPEGFLVIGDGISSFNPIYGQGMSAAALQAAELAKTFADGSDNLAKKFFTRAAKVLDTPWSIAVGNDLRMPEVLGARNPGITFINWYMSKLHKAAHHDRVPANAFFQVANLLAPPASVLHPRIALHVLRGNLFRRPVQAEVGLSAAAGK